MEFSWEITIYFILNIAVLRMTWQDIKTDFMLVIFITLFGSIMTVYVLIIILLRI